MGADEVGELAHRAVATRAARDVVDRGAHLVDGVGHGDGQADDLEEREIDELAFAVAFLCSDRSAAITGSAIHIDAGARMLG